MNFGQTGEKSESWFVRLCRWYAALLDKWTRKTSPPTPEAPKLVLEDPPSHMTTWQGDKVGNHQWKYDGKAGFQTESVRPTKWSCKRCGLAITARDGLKDPKEIRVDEKLADCDTMLIALIQRG